MHILLLHIHTGKPNPVYQEIATGLRRRKHEVWVGTPNSDGDLECRDGSRVVAVLPGPYARSPTTNGPRSGAVRLSKRWNYLNYILRVRAFLAKTAPDIIQVNYSALTWLLPPFLPAKTHCVLDIRQINEAVGARTRSRESRVLMGMTIAARYFYEHTCFCHTEAAKRILGLTWPQRSSVIPVGVDPMFLADRPASGVDASATRAAPTTATRFVYIGALSKLRNLDRLLEAARLLKARNIQFHLDMIGPDHTAGEYRALITAWGINDVVTIRDPIPYDRVSHMLLAYDVGIAYVPDRPTWHYQPAIKALEYRALGMPILSTDVLSHREIVESGVNGVLVPDTSAGVADGMARFASDASFLSSCRGNALKMRRGITWTEVVRMYDENVYQELCNRS